MNELADLKNEKKSILKKKGTDVWYNSMKARHKNFNIVNGCVKIIKE